MLKKIRLDQTKKYELNVAAREFVKMLVLMIQGKSHSTRIGSEQGLIKHWDDFVIEKANGDLLYIQVKDQNTPFSTYAVNRGTLSRGPKKGDPQPLSELDEAMRSLGEWMASHDPITEDPKKNFLIVAPEGTVDLKKEITLGNLANLCLNDIKSTTNVQGLNNLKANNSHAKHICIWLKDWCGITNDETVLRVLKNLRVMVTGNDVAIEEESKNLLSSCFDKPDEVLAAIKTFLTDNTSFSNLVAPRDLYKSLVKNLLSGITGWTQYELEAGIWKISGINDLTNAEIERPSETVPKMWDPNKPAQLNFKAHRHDSELSRAILRMAFHMKNLPTAHFEESAAWITVASQMVGGTLGLDADDCEDQNLKITNTATLHGASEFRQLENSTKHDEEAKAMVDVMNNLTWEKLTNGLTAHIQAMNATPLRAEVEARWTTWKRDLSASPDRRYKFLTGMLTLNAEGSDIRSELRLGPKTTKLLKEGIFLWLIVSIAMNETDAGWENFGGELSVGACALSYWSGPSGTVRKARKITDEDGKDRLLGQASSKIFLLTNIDSSPTEVAGELMANSKKMDKSLASPHQPPIIITNSTKVKRLIQDGDISQLRSYFQSLVNAAMTPANPEL